MQYAIQNSEYMYPGTGRVANLNPDFHILDFRKCDVLLKRSSIIIWHLHTCTECVLGSCEVLSTFMYD
jgi:hypothetical protein